MFWRGRTALTRLFGPFRRLDKRSARGFVWSEGDVSSSAPGDKPLVATLPAICGRCLNYFNGELPDQPVSFRPSLAPAIARNSSALSIRGTWFFAPVVPGFLVRAYSAAFSFNWRRLTRSRARSCAEY